MNTLFKEHNFRLITITPLSIGADKGRALSPYTDYFIADNGKKAYLVSPKILEPFFRRKPELIQEFSIGVSKNMDNTRSDFELSSFIQNRVGVDISTLPQVDIIGLSKNSHFNVAAIVKDAGRPFIPGSSLKGVFRTAILYYWLLKTDTGWQHLQNSLDKVVDSFKIHNVKEKQDSLKSVLDESALFGKLGDREKAPFSSYWVFRDSKPLNNATIAFTQAERIRIKNDGKVGKNTIPQPKESIMPNSSSEMSFLIQKNKITETHPLSILNTSTQKIIQTLCQFSLDFVNWEIEELENQKNLKRPQVKKLYDFYVDLQERMTSGEMFLRLGAGKTFYDNSIVLAILKSSKERKYNFGDYEDFCDAFKKEIKSKYPITRTVAANGLPFGWVKIEAI